jgi:tRNA nucleotidyltransferase (CCA-adding enzyme)
MKGLGVYGSEIKTGGFSGYLCELLTLHCGSFVGVLNSFKNWEGKRIIDPEGYYKGREKEAIRFFREPLVVVDPVDKRRNVASSLRKDRLDEFIAAARMFLKRPNSHFFYPRETETLSIERLVQKIASRGSAIIFLRFGQVNAVPDVLWGQLYRSQRALRKILQRNDFSVIRDCVWSDEKDVNILIFELKHRLLPSVIKHFGPPIHKRIDSENFIQKHLSSPATISGPRIEEGRWMIESERQYTDVVSLLSEKLKDGGGSHGIAKLISQAISKKLELFVNAEISDLYSRDQEFAKFLTEYLDGRSKWLKVCLF